MDGIIEFISFILKHTHCADDDDECGRRRRRFFFRRRRQSSCGDAASDADVLSSFMKISVYTLAPTLNKKRKKK